MDLSKFIRTISDFPSQGILFRDITTLLQHPQAFRYVVDQLYTRYVDQQVDAIIGIDARGFIIASPLAYRLGCSLVLARKAGKLPFDTLRQDYALEYGSAQLEMHIDALPDDARVVIVDDLLATGGTLVAATQLVSRYKKAKVLECSVVIELPDLAGRSRLQPHSVHSLVTFAGD